MENILGDLTGLVSYITLGVLFFFVAWGFVEKVAKTMFPHAGVGKVIGFLVATYGFWYPFIPAMRIFYLVFLSGVAVFGTGFSRFGVVTKSTLHGKYAAAGVALALISFEVIYYIVVKYLEGSPYTVLGVVISWGLLVYGITQIEFIRPVIEDMGLPRTTMVYAAFILACVIFLPLEFPLIYTVMSGAAVIGSVLGWIAVFNT